MEVPKKRIHIICPVRGATDEQKKEMDDYVPRLRMPLVRRPKVGKYYFMTPKTDKISVLPCDPTGYKLVKIDKVFKGEYSRDYPDDYICWYDSLEKFTQSIVCPFQSESLHLSDYHYYVATKKEVAEAIERQRQTEHKAIDDALDKF